MGLAVTAIGVICVCLLGLLRVRRPTWFFLGVLVLIVISTVLTIGAYGDGLLDRLASVDDASETRTTLYSQILALISQRPWTGFGGGSFEIVFPLVHASPVSPDLVWDKAHNTYLALWVEMGVVFGSLPPAILLLTTLHLLRSLIQRVGSWRSQATALGAITVAGVHSLVDFSLEIEANAFVLTSLVALGLAGSTLGRRRS
jgi:O-antigen ligase